MDLHQILQALIAFDHQLFTKINTDWVGPIFDLYFSNITDLHRQPVAIAVAAFAIGYWIFRQRTRALKGLLVLVIAVAAADLVTYRILKPTFMRDRPAEAGLQVQVQLRSEHNSGSSFPSNHAANIFAAATIVTFLYPPYFLVASFVALSVAYSRVYVGAHFPSDVLAGAFLGFLLARFVWSLLGHWVDRIDFSDSDNRSRFYITRARDEINEKKRRLRKRK